MLVREWQHSRRSVSWLNVEVWRHYYLTMTHLSYSRTSGGAEKETWNNCNEKAFEAYAGPTLWVSHPKLGFEWRHIEGTMAGKSLKVCQRHLTTTMSVATSKIVSKVKKFEEIKIALFVHVQPPRPPTQPRIEEYALCPPSTQIWTGEYSISVESRINTRELSHVNQSVPFDINLRKIYRPITRANQNNRLPYLLLY